MTCISLTLPFFLFQRTLAFDVEPLGENTQIVTWDHALEIKLRTIGNNYPKELIELIFGNSQLRKVLDQTTSSVE